MNEFPNRRQNRIEHYDYASPGVYFVTLCTADRAKILWESVGADTIRPQEISLSAVGKIAEQSILQTPTHYDGVFVDKYCIMPDHIHLLLRIEAENGRMISAPTVSAVVGSMKRWVSKTLGRSVWQKSFYDHVVRNRQDYEEIWRYIDENPLKYR